MNDLVKRLRTICNVCGVSAGDEEPDYWPNALEAADRIEALEAALRDVKTNALNCQPADVPAALAHIVRLCIDALAPEQDK